MAVGAARFKVQKPALSLSNGFKVQRLTRFPTPPAERKQGNDVSMDKRGTVCLSHDLTFDGLGAAQDAI
jgi:hypothetical protein